MSGFEGDSLPELAMTLASPTLLVIVVGTAINAFSLPTVHRFNQRLRAGRHGDYAMLPLAPIQLTSDASVLTLPITITLRSQRFAKIPMSVLGGLAISLITAITMFSFLVPAAIAGNELTTLDLIIPAGTCGAFILVGFVEGLRPSQEAVEITEHGLLLCQNSSPDQSIRWDDVRLFAIGACAGGKDSPASMAYILASPNNSVTWGRIHRITWYTYLRPIIPFEEYNRQTEALLSLIAARTGLPLYDLW